MQFYIFEIESIISVLRISSFMQFLMQMQVLVSLLKLII